MAEKHIAYRVEEVLMNVWDPIGVAGIPEAKGEYDSYIGRVLLLLERKGTPEEIADYLDSVVTTQMGLVARRDHSTKVAQKLLALTNGGS